MKTIARGEFADSSSKDVLESLVELFEITPEDQKEIAEVWYANLYSGGYEEGISVVLLRKSGVLGLVSAAHCSCYGFEGQWDGNDGPGIEGVSGLKAALDGLYYPEVDESDKKTLLRSAEKLFGTKAD